MCTKFWLDNQKDKDQLKIFVCVGGWY